MNQELMGLNKFLKNTNYKSRISRLKKMKKSNTIFILGSGSSINTITNWNLIRQNDSIGFNYFFINNFIPTFYFIEQTRIIENQAVYSNIISKRVDYLNKTMLLLKYRQNFDKIKKVLDENKIKHFIVKTLTFNSETTQSLEQQAIRYLSDNLLNNLFHKSQGVASVEQYVLLSMKMGYKKIVLCGVDLNNTKYFYEDKRYDEYRRFNMIPISGQTSNIHKTNEKSSCWGNITLSETIKIYNKLFIAMGGEIFVANKNSELAKILPVIEL